MKKLTFKRTATPKKPGYNDSCIIAELAAIQGTYECSTEPNAVRPSDGVVWDKAYGEVAPIITTFKCIVSPKHGKCLAVNNLLPVPTTNENSNHDGAKIAADVEVHCGDSVTHRGSAACFTIFPPLWESFISHFEVGEVGQLVLVNSN